ncbi:hypothetical protein GF352_01885|nr:hypothetical protein [archaeon]
MAKIQDVNLVDKIDFVIKRGIKFKKPVIIEGFQGVGLVGTLSAQYLSQQLDFEQIGFIDSEGVPPMALLVDGKVMNPIKIYANKARDIVIIESELSIPRKIIYELSEMIADWAKKIKAQEIICLEGINVPEEERDYEIFGMSTDEKKMKKLINKGVKRLDNGIIIGMSAALLLKSMEKKVPATCLLIESRRNFPDGHAAAELLKVMGSIYDFKIDVADLKKQANAFEKKIDKVLSHVKKLKKIEGDSEKTSIYG